MKPFDLEAALAGAPVVTRSGKPVTQLVKFDAIRSPFNLFGVVDGEVYSWGESGGYDLFMATVKREGWINIYKDLSMCCIHPTKEKADENAGAARIACAKFEWEE